MRPNKNTSVSFKDSLENIQSHRNIKVEMSEVCRLLQKNKVDEEVNHCERENKQEIMKDCVDPCIV